MGKSGAHEDRSARAFLGRWFFDVMWYQKARVWVLSSGEASIVMSGKSYPKKHHYVPQFLLKNFSENKKALWAYDKTERNIHPVSIGDAGAETHFNSYPDDSGLQGAEKVAVELALSDMDSAFSAVLKDLIEGLNASKTISRTGFPNYLLDSKLLSELSYLAVFQTVRTKEFREELHQMELLSYKALFDFFKDTLEGKEILGNRSLKGFNISLNDGADKLRQFDMMFKPEFIEKLVTHCENKVWTIGVNQTNKPLSIADNPVVMRSRIGSSAAWGAKGVEIALPVSSEYILLWTCPSLHSRDKYGVSTARDIDCRTVSLSESNVVYYNSLSYRESTRYIYQQTNDFTLFEDMAEKGHPDERNPYRQRASVNAFGKEFVLPADYKSKGIPLG